MTMKGLPDSSQFHFKVVDKDALRTLKRLADLPLFPRYSLAGGTGLALQFCHRVSRDLDFFRQTHFPTRS